MSNTDLKMASLQGQFLISTPGIGDERFTESVIFLVGHNDDGAMGLMINHVLPDISLGDILVDLDLNPAPSPDSPPSDQSDDIRAREVMRGGPVDTERGFVLHSADYFKQGTSFAVSPQICLTASKDILRAISVGDAPENSLLALGYCGWDAGQLENELKGDGWLTLPHSDDLLFRVTRQDCYDKALGALGINRASLSGVTGSA